MNECVLGDSVRVHTVLDIVDDFSRIKLSGSVVLAFRSPVFFFFRRGSFFSRGPGTLLDRSLCYKTNVFYPYKDNFIDTHTFSGP